MRYPELFLVIFSIFVNCCFLLVTNKKYFFAGLIASHGEVAYNLAMYNSPKINPLRLATIEQQQDNAQELIDYALLDSQQKELRPCETRNINDTLGYGIILGMLWKITQRYSYQDIQFLQLILYCLCILLFYRSCILLSNNTLWAFVCSVTMILFFPVIFLNVHPLRDVWAFYGLVILMYSMIRVYKTQECTKSIWMYGSLFGLCQWVRPPIFFTLIFFFFISFFMPCRALRKSLIYYIIINIFAFWLPFCVYNYYAYQQPLVSCMGQDLYEGLGEIPNSWGVMMNDQWCKEKILTEYGLAYGTCSFQAQALTLFINALKESPTEYLWQILRRIPSLFIFCATMIHNKQEFEWAYDHYQSNIALAVTWGMELLSNVERLCYYGRLYLLLGWIGILVLIAQGNYFLALLIVGCAFSGASKIISHLEPRYLIPHYAFFAYSVGNLFCTLWQRRIRII